MRPEIALLENYLIIGAMLFGIGLIGMLTRRNMIVMFLCVEMMLQGVSLSLVAWSRYRNDFGGQMLVIFIIAVAACEAAVALALMQTLFQRTGTLDIAGWQALRETSEPAFAELPLAEEPDAQPQWPKLTPAGVQPEVSREELENRPHV
jgi:NADH-quinone oxidoreductase subunit K